MIVQKQDRGVSLGVKLILGVIAALVLLVLAYQRTFRSDYTQSVINDARPAIVPVQKESPRPQPGGEKLSATADQPAAKQLAPITVHKEP